MFEFTSRGRDIHQKECSEKQILGSSREWHINYLANSIMHVYKLMHANYNTYQMQCIKDVRCDLQAIDAIKDYSCLRVYSCYLIKARMLYYY